MKNTDLMIGDWVQHGEGVCKVVSIAGKGIFFEDSISEGVATFDMIFPIPLTPEILEKNTDGGFCDFKDPIIGYKCKRSLYWIGKVGIYVEWERMIGVPYVEFQGLADTFFKGYIKSLHELQHALRLCGIEKEITL